MKDNFKIILWIYFAIFYIMPIFIDVFYYQYMNDIYKLDQTSIVLIILFLFSLSVFILYGRHFNFLTINYLFKNLFKFNWVLIALGFIFFGLSLIFFSTYNIKFRHTGENLTDAGGWVIILVGLRGFFKAFLFYALIARFKNIPIKINRYLFLIISVSYTLSMVSSLDIVMISLSALLFLNKENLLAQNELKTKSLFIKARNIILSVSIMASIIFIGTANKIGTDNAKELFQNEDIFKFILVNTGLRLSTYYASIHGAIKFMGQKDKDLSDGFFGALQNTFNRGVYLLTGEKLPRPEIWSIYRINYLNLFRYDIRDSTGASPGIVASIFYGPSIIIGIAFIVVYLFVILFLLKWALSFSFRLNLLGLLVCTSYVLPFFESPFDLVNIFNPSFIFIYSMMGGIFYLMKKSFNYARKSKVYSSRNSL